MQERIDAAYVRKNCLFGVDFKFDLIPYHDRDLIQG
jgi:hypothetical protein